MLKNALVKWYLWRIGRELPGNRKRRKAILSRVENSVQDYVIENPYVNYKLLQRRFGTPRQIAESYIQEMDSSEVLLEMRSREKMLKAVLTALSLFVLIWFGFCAAAYYQHTVAVNGSGVIEIEIIEQTEIVEEDE